jgi:hypothetical protein
MLRRLNARAGATVHGKALMSARLFLVAAAFCLLMAPSDSEAKLKTRGEGKQRVLVAEQFTGDTRTRYDLFAVRCTKCHEMNRPIVALETGVTPVTGGKFDRDGMKAYVVKMMRKPKSGVTKEEAREILQFLWDARDVALEP